MRSLRGQVISLREVRYVDPEFIDALEAEIVEHTEAISQNCVVFLMDDKALSPYHTRVEEKKGEIEGITTVAEGKALQEEVGRITADLEMLIDIVSNLKIEDTSKSTHIINNISLIFATLNRVKADIKNKITSLGSKEAKADFAAQIKLIDQSIVNALDRATTPEKQKNCSIKYQYNWKTLKHVLPIMKSLPVLSWRSAKRFTAHSKRRKMP